MFSTPHPNFDRMDELSMKKVPFFFMVDFLLENVEVYDDREFLDSGLKTDFQSVESAETPLKEYLGFHFKSSPESAENYRRGFTLVQENLRAGNTYLA